MKMFGIFKKKKGDNANAEAQALYTRLTSPAYQIIYKQEDANEGMSIAEEVICQYWKPRYLLDHKSKCAYEFMTGGEYLTTITEDDIDWDSLNGLAKEYLDRAHNLYAHFPTRIRDYKNGVAEVSWQLNPDGRYYMDEDGFGMTDDEEVEIYGFINRQGKVLVKFQDIHKEWDRLKSMRKEAERINN